jgi:hypothetical protein
MFALLVMVAGIAFMFGAKDFATRVLRGVLGAVLVVAVVPCVARSCASCLPGLDRTSQASASSGLSMLILATVLAVIGFVAWRRRADRAKAREMWARRNGAPRTRALPAPPSTPGEGRS